MIHGSLSRNQNVNYSGNNNNKNKNKWKYCYLGFFLKNDSLLFDVFEESGCDFSSYTIFFDINRTDAIDWAIKRLQCMNMNWVKRPRYKCATIKPKLVVFHCECATALNAIQMTIHVIYIIRSSREHG